MVSICYGVASSVKCYMGSLIIADEWLRGTCGKLLSDACHLGALVESVAYVSPILFDGRRAL